MDPNFSPKATKDQRGMAKTAPGAVIEDKEAVAIAHLISFQPLPDIEGKQPIGRGDFATAAYQSLMRQIIGARIRVWTIVVIALGVACLALWFGTGLYLDSKIRSARALSLKGEELVRNNKVEEAIPIVRAAFQLSASNPEVLRAMAQTITALNDPAAMIYWNRVLQTKEATDDDRRAAAECAMQNDLYDKASTLICDLVVREGNDARNQLLAARWSAERASAAQTMFFATRAVKDDPTYKPAVFFLTQQELADPRLHQEGIKSLFQLANSNDDWGLRALRPLTLDPSLKPAEIDLLIDRLHSHPLAGEFERLAALALSIERHPGERETLLNQAVVAHKKAVPADVATFAEWLDSNHEAARVLTFIPREKALSNKGLFAAYIDALAGLKRWAELKALLSGTNVPLETSLVELFLSRCDSETGDELGSEVHWKSAVFAAENEPAQSFYLAMYAEKLGQKERAAAVYRRLTMEPVIARIAYKDLARVLSDKDTRNLRDLYDEMVERWSNDDDMATMDIFLNLLLNERVKEMHQRAVDLLTDDSYSIPHRTNVALACLRLNEPADALKVYSHVSIDWDRVAAPDLVVYAATLRANGQSNTAHQLLIPVNRQSLRPELRKLLNSVP